MPKRVGNLYQQMLDKEFIKDTIVEAAKGRGKRFDIKPVLKHLDYYVDKTYNMLSTDSYTPTVPKERRIYDTSSEKWRVIKIVPFWPDGVVQWLMVQVMKPVMLRGMYHWSCASIPGRGGSRVREYTSRILAEDPENTAFAEELDVYHFYPSIKVSTMIALVSRKIKDKRFIRLMSTILYSATDAPDAGLAIGYYICQWLANFYLESLDLYITTLKGVSYYTRYMDNMILYSSSKEALHAARLRIQAFLHDKLGLELKHTWQVFNTSTRKVAAVGYRFARNFIILRKRNVLRIMKQCRRVNKKIANHQNISVQLASGLLSRLGQLTHCFNKTVYDKHLSRKALHILKEVVSNESKRKYCSQQCVLA